MKFFLYENFPKAAAGILEGMGHEVFDLRGSDREGFSDRDIFAEAQRCAAVFLTTARDFFHTIPRLHEKHARIVMLGTVPCRASEFLRLFAAKFHPGSLGIAG